MTNNQPASDFILRVGVLSHIFHDVCRCHVFTDPTKRCSRCDILTRAASMWEYEYKLTLEAYNEQKKGGPK